MLNEGSKQALDLAKRSEVLYLEDQKAAEPKFLKGSRLNRRIFKY